ncbi:MAG: cadherin-like beta sandwich domain-containing protein [Bacilli bacterium]|nr:cadherin-like beta sandwich domain-containing protein [Bacilli bacterium]
MKNIISRILFIIIIFMVGIGNVSAAGKYTISLSSTSVSKGKSVTLYIKATDCAGKFNVSTSDATVANLSSGYVFADNNTETITVNTINAGSAIITVTAADVTDYDNNKVTGTKTLKINVSGESNNSNGGNSSSVSNEKKSSDASLKSLSIENINISPEFKSDVLDYKAEAEAGIEKIKINAIANDDKATVSGIGEVSVSSGANKLEVIVAAEDGTTKTYVVNLTVKEYDPIVVKIGKKKYTVVRKKDDLPDVDLFEDKKIKIDKDEVDGYYNDKLKIYLVGLKDEKGNIKMYIYEPDDNSYTLYKWVTVGKITLFINKPVKKISNFKKFNTIINNTKVDIYKLFSSEKIGLIYGTNVATGNKGYYVYDKSEDTLARYYDKVVGVVEKKYKKKNSMLMIILGVVSSVLIIVDIVLIIVNRKGKKKTRR